jgi:hypothetical protein
MGNKLEIWMVDIQKDNELRILNAKNQRVNFSSSLDIFNSKSRNKWYGFKKMFFKKMFFLFIEKNSKIK